MAERMYEIDIVGWSEDQAARLRRLAAGEEPSDIGVDWSNVIEEIEAVGRGERRAVLSESATALFHALMAGAVADVVGNGGGVVSGLFNEP